MCAAISGGNGYGISTGLRCPPKIKTFVHTRIGWCVHTGSGSGSERDERREALGSTLGGRLPVQSLMRTVAEVVR
jgi:hypothetical protein